MDANVTERSGTQNSWRAMLWGGLAIVLSLPALAMSLGAEGVDWSISDFIVMSGLLAVFGFTIEAFARLFPSWPARLATMSLALLIVIAIWVELAVGVFGTPFAGS